jgi:hypothetical protein
MVFLPDGEATKRRLGFWEIFARRQYLIAVFANGLFRNSKQSPHVIATLSTTEPFVEDMQRHAAGGRRQSFLTAS